MTTAHDTPGGPARRALTALGRCLSAFGAMHIALPDPQHAGAAAPGTPRPAAGPPPAHPERLCAHRPLTEQELRLARQLWPASYPERRDRGR